MDNRGQVLKTLSSNDSKKNNNNACAVFMTYFSIDLKGKERTCFNDLVAKYGWTVFTRYSNGRRTKRYK